MFIRDRVLKLCEHYLADHVWEFHQI